jgi:hypothetical protein
MKTPPKQSLPHLEDEDHQLHDGPDELSSALSKLTPAQTSRLAEKLMESSHENKKTEASIAKNLGHLK